MLPTMNKNFAFLIASLLMSTSCFASSSITVYDCNDLDLAQNAVRTSSHRKVSIDEETHNVAVLYSTNAERTSYNVLGLCVQGSSPESFDCPNIDPKDKSKLSFTKLDANSGFLTEMRQDQTGKLLASGVSVLLCHK